MSQIQLRLQRVSRILSGRDRQGGTLHRLGKLLLASGKIAACDPLANPERPAFTRAAPKGQHPVLLFTDGDQPAFSAVLFTRKPVVTWEMALLKGQRERSRGPDEIFGYAVDTGVGCFADRDALTVLERASDEVGKNGSNYFDEVLRPALDENDGLFANHRPVRGKPDNVVAFASGPGDGTYASYWGLDQRGGLAALVTDFGLLQVDTMSSRLTPELRATITKARRLHKAKQLKQARKVIEAGLAEAPDQIELLDLKRSVLADGLEWIAKNEVLDEIIAVCDQIVARRSDEDAFFQRAQYREKRKIYAGAAEDYLTAIEKGAPFYFPFVGAIACLLELNDAKRAVSLERQAMSVGADNSDVLNNLAVAHFRLGHRAKAKALIAEAVELDDLNQFPRQQIATNQRLIEQSGRRLPRPIHFLA